MTKYIMCVCSECGESVDFAQEENVVCVRQCQPCLKKSVYKLLDKVKEILELSNDLMEEIQW